jgi:hypothetical protein
VGLVRKTILNARCSAISDLRWKAELRDTETIYIPNCSEWLRFVGTECSELKDGQGILVWASSRRIQEG